MYRHRSTSLTGQHSDLAPPQFTTDLDEKLAHRDILTGLTHRLTNVDGSGYQDRLSVWINRGLFNHADRVRSVGNGSSGHYANRFALLKLLIRRVSGQDRADYSQTDRTLGSIGRS